jgi:serine/threonine-protein kinase
VPQQLGGRYELGDLLGRGGMAEVHIGRDSRLGRTVAVKMLRPDLAREPSFQARFRREAHSAASLNHPSIAAVYDTGEDQLNGNPVPYIVMEYVEGSTLRDLLASGSRLMPERALEIVDGILAALAYSHQGGIVHRDIKPANVMLTGSGEVKVMDFGIARAVADDSVTMTQTSAVMGTAQYLSPEQARGEQVDARSDLYSTGCLLYELLTGQPPFVGESPVSVAYQHVREEPLPPSSVDPDVPPAADAVTLRALTKDRDHRYQTADEMRADIRRALAGQTVAAPVAAAATQRVAAPAAAATSTLTAMRDDDEPEDRRGRALTYALLGLAVVAVFVIAALIGKALFDSSDAAQVAVPDVRGLSVADARDTLRAEGLTVGNITRENNRNVDEGDVIDQNPAADSRLEEGGEVSLTVSLGVAETAVPELVGLSLDEASRALSEAGLRLGERTPVTSTEVRNTVTKARPAEGTTVPDGSTVDLEVASGSNEVPEVEGLSREEARSLLEEAGFSVEEQERETADADPGEVVRQSPRGGATARLESTVTIVVATEPPSPSPTPTTTTPTASGTPTELPSTPGGG